MKRCYNGGNKHRFKARYSEQLLTRPFESHGCSAYEIRKILFYNVYVKDICVWCGKEIKK